MKIAAIVVTFNRRDMLKKCMQGIAAQKRPVDHIFIVNNASGDGTREYLDTNFGENSRVTLCHLSENTGGAGGFHSGMKLATEAGGYDWYWLMDDDVVPRPDCLQRLVSFSSLSQCIHPRKQHRDGTFFQWYGRFDPRSARLKSIPEENAWENSEYLTVNYGCFEGMLIANDIVRRIGLPDKEYFICYDDRIYGYKASLHTPVLYVRDALMDKLIKKKPGSYSPFSYYYQVRNLFLLRRDLKSCGGLIDAKWAAYIAMFLGKNSVKYSFMSPVGRAAILTVKGIKDGIIKARKA